jgi:hypothetical protein
MTFITKCTCKNIYQDNTYGEAMRVFNVITKEPKGSHGKCSICGVERSKGGGSDDPKSKNKGKN